MLGPRNVWVFGTSIWHFNGSSWKRSAVHGLIGASGLSADSIWAFGGRNVAHWNGHSWKKTSVSSLLPAKRTLNGPSVTGIYAQSSHSIWAVGDGNAQDAGGPLVVLHYNGHSWKRVARSSVHGYPGASVAPDGHGGLWIPVSGASGGLPHFLHYASGHLRTESLPASAGDIEVELVAAIPNSGGQAFAAGFTHASGNAGRDDEGAILQYGG